MSDKVEATFSGESKVAKAVRLRRKYDEDFTASGAEARGAEARWIEAEDDLDRDEYVQYQEAYYAPVSETNSTTTNKEKPHGVL